MAFNTGGNSRGNGDRDDSWKADGFLNFYLPTREGGRKKLGSIPLKASKPNEKALLDGLNKSEEERDRILQLIMNRLLVEFNSTTPNENALFDLDVAAAT
jgi:hypothetical protein